MHCISFFSWFLSVAIHRTSSLGSTVENSLHRVGRKDVKRLKLRWRQIAHDCILMLIAHRRYDATTDGAMMFASDRRNSITCPHNNNYKVFTFTTNGWWPNKLHLKVCCFFWFHLIFLSSVSSALLFFFSVFASPLLLLLLIFISSVHSGPHLHFIIPIKLCCALNFVARESARLSLMSSERIKWKNCRIFL